MKFVMLIDLQMMEQLSKDHFCENQEYECGGQLKVKIHMVFCFMGTTYEAFHLDKLSLVQ
jgi:hypothetical protein